MIEENARVIEVRNNRALVQTTRSTACDNCSAKAGCAALGGSRDARVWAADTVGVDRGDEVVVAVPEGSLLGASALAYLFPVIALIGAAWVGHRYVAPLVNYSTDLVAAGMGITAMVVAFLIGRKIAEKRIRGPSIIRNFTAEAAPTTDDEDVSQA